MAGRARLVCFRLVAARWPLMAGRARLVSLHTFSVMPLVADGGRSRPAGVFSRCLACCWWPVVAGRVQLVISQISGFLPVVAGGGRWWLVVSGRAQPQFFCCILLFAFRFV